MAKSNKGKSPKGRKPLFYVDNPNASELKWLEEVKRKKPVQAHQVEKKPVQVNAVAEVEEAIEQPKQDVQAEQAVLAVPVEQGESAAFETFDVSSEAVYAEQPLINVEEIEVEAVAEAS